MKSITIILPAQVFLTMLSIIAVLRVHASPLLSPLSLRQDSTTTPTPNFPSDIPSCVICQENYSNIDACAEAAPVLANFTEILFNPGAFIDVIKCACTETFESVFPQCVDCFQKTNQTDILNTPDLSSVVTGMRDVCAVASTLLGNVSNSDGETSSTMSGTSSATANVAQASATNSAISANAVTTSTVALIALAAMLTLENVLS